MKKKPFSITKKNQSIIDFISNKDFGGHFTILSFTTHYKFAFGTVTEREDIEYLTAYDNINDAITNAIQEYLTTTQTMNQHKMYRCIRLMEFLQDKPRNMHTMAKYLNVNTRTVYRYLKLYEALGYLVTKDKFDKIQLVKL